MKKISNKYTNKTFEDIKHIDDKEVVKMDNNKKGFPKISISWATHIFGNPTSNH